MKKNVLLAILLLFLMVMNGILLYLVLNKPERRERPPRNFIAQQLDLDENQLEEFNRIERTHHREMRRIDGRFRDLKEMLFMNLNNRQFTEKELDSVTQLIGKLSIDREKEVFLYFKALEGICTEKQKIQLENIVSGALKPNFERGGPPPPHR